MFVLVPYVGQLHAEVVDALRNATHGEHESKWVDVGGSDRAYHDLIADAWKRGESFAIVEHDIVVRPDTLDALAGCPEDWCAYPYPYVGTMHYGLGCVRFSADLIARNPRLMDRVAVMWDEKHCKRHWCRQDAFINVVLNSAGERLHRHMPMVGHLSDTVSHGC